MITIIKYLVINEDNNQTAKVLKIYLNKDCTVRSLKIKYKNDKNKYVLKANKDNFTIIELRGLKNIIKNWYLF